jgi:hypothetical protein
MNRSIEPGLLRRGGRRRRHKHTQNPEKDGKHSARLAGVHSESFRLIKIVVHGEPTPSVLSDIPGIAAGTRHTLTLQDEGLSGLLERSRKKETDKREGEPSGLPSTQKAADEEIPYLRDYTGCDLPESVQSGGICVWRPDRVVIFSPQSALQLRSC